MRGLVRPENLETPTGHVVTVGPWGLPHGARRPVSPVARGSRRSCGGWSGRPSGGNRAPCSCTGSRAWARPSWSARSPTGRVPRATPCCSRGACGSVRASSPYLPFLSAFEGWLAEGHSDAGLHLGPLYGDRDATAPSSALHVIDRAVAHLAEQGPVVLLVDDLQWADTSSMDALAYLIAGRRRQPVALLVAYRDVGLPDGHALWGWLADMLRMPGVVELPLARLTLEETAEQLTALWGTPPATAAAARGVGAVRRQRLPDRAARPRRRPQRRRAARRHLRCAAHRTAGALAQPHPARPRRQPGAGDVRAGRWTRSSWREGRPEASTSRPHCTRRRRAGVVEHEPGGLVWFRHPLLSDVLYSTLLPAEARDLHAAFVRVLDDDSGDAAFAHRPGPALRGRGDVRRVVRDESGRCRRRPPPRTDIRKSSVLLRQACDLWVGRLGGGPPPARLARGAAQRVRPELPSHR